MDIYFIINNNSFFFFFFFIIKKKELIKIKKVTLLILCMWCFYNLIYYWIIYAKKNILQIRYDLIVLFYKIINMILKIFIVRKLF